METIQQAHHILDTEIRPKSRKKYISSSNILGRSATKQPGLKVEFKLKKTKTVRHICIKRYQNTSSK